MTRSVHIHTAGILVSVSWNVARRSLQVPGPRVLAGQYECPKQKWRVPTPPILAEMGQNVRRSWKLKTTCEDTLPQKELFSFLRSITQRERPSLYMHVSVRFSTSSFQLRVRYSHIMLVFFKHNDTRLCYREKYSSAFFAALPQGNSQVCVYTRRCASVYSFNMSSFQSPVSYSHFLLVFFEEHDMRLCYRKNYSSASLTVSPNGNDQVCICTRRCASVCRLPILSSIKSYHARLLQTQRHAVVLPRKVFFGFLGRITQRAHLAYLAMLAQRCAGALQYVEFPI